MISSLQSKKAAQFDSLVKATVEAEYSESLLPLVFFTLGNGFLFLAFCALWVWQYHIDSNISERVDDFLPFIWLVGFFSVSAFSVRRPLVKAIAISTAATIVLSGLLWITTRFVLVPLFDPMF